MKCASAVDSQIGYVVDVIVICGLYREAVPEMSRWLADRHHRYVAKIGFAPEDVRGVVEKSDGGNRVLRSD